MVNANSLNEVRGGIAVMKKGLLWKANGKKMCV